MEEVVLQIWQVASGKFAGRILRGGVEDGSVTDCVSKSAVECRAIEAGIEYDRVEIL